MATKKPATTDAKVPATKAKVSKKVSKKAAEAPVEIVAETAVTDAAEAPQTETSVEATPAESVPTPEVTPAEAKPLAKAGKRSERAVKEAEELAEKEARKATGDTSPTDPDAVVAVKKGAKPITRPLIERRGKKYRELAKQVETGKIYSLAEALDLATKTNPARFDASVEFHVVLGVDPRQADQNVRATVSLPHGTGKNIRVAAFVGADDIEAATSAGAAVAGEEAVMALLDKEQLDFDILVATPQMMPKLGKYARLLGPRGLMPNPKSGTVATNAAAAVREAKGGRVEFRVDKQSIVHLAIGKVSFGADKLQQNAQAFLDSLQSVKPSSLKNVYIKTVSVSTTMGPGIKVDISSL